MFWFIFRFILGIFAVALAAAISYLSLKGFSAGSLNAGDVVLALSAIPIVLTKTWIIATNIGSFAEYFGQINDAMETLVQPRKVRDRNQAEIMSVAEETARIDMNMHTHSSPN